MLQEANNFNDNCSDPGTGSLPTIRDELRSYFSKSEIATSRFKDKDVKEVLSVNAADKQNNVTIEN